MNALKEFNDGGVYNIIENYLEWKSTKDTCSTTKHSLNMKASF